MRRQSGRSTWRATRRLSRKRGWREGVGGCGSDSLRLSAPFWGKTEGKAGDVGGGDFCTSGALPTSHVFHQSRVQAHRTPHAVFI